MLHHITVDHRESSSSAARALSARNDLELEARDLPFGDYLVGEQVVVRRMTIEDFNDAVRQGRLVSEACAPEGTDLRVVLILEGGTGAAGGRGVSRQALQGALVTLGCGFGIPVLRARDGEETAWLIACIARAIEPRTSHRVIRQPRRPRGVDLNRQRVVQGIPGIGPVRANRLLEHFGSLERIASADAADLARIASIGPALAERMRRILAADPRR